MYALLGVDDDKEKECVGKFEFRPLGQGVQDFPAILKAAEESGTKWLIVEQDAPSMDLTALECIKAGIDYLKTL